MIRICVFLVCILILPGSVFAEEIDPIVKKYNVYMGPFSEKHIPKVTSTLDSLRVKYKIIGQGRILFYRSQKKPTPFFFKSLYGKLGRLKRFLKRKVTYERRQQKELTNLVVDKNNKEMKQEQFQSLFNFSGLIKVFPQYHYQTYESLYPLVFELKDSFDLSESILFNAGLFSAVDINEVSANFIDTRSFNLSYRFSLGKMTVGAQVLSWGRVFENSILAGFNREFFKFGPQLTLAERSLDQWAVRAEIYKSDFKVDAVVIPFFRHHEYAKEGRPWSLFSKNRGEFVLGPDPETNPTFSQLVRLSALDTVENNNMGWGIRATNDNNQFSWGLTIYQAPSLNPYFSINSQTLFLIGLGQTPEQAVANTSGAEFFSNFPMLTTAALDGFFESLIGSFRFEAGYEKGTPMTTADFQYINRSSFKWNLSFESFFRDDQDTFNLLLSGINLFNDRDILEFQNQYYLTAQYRMDLAVSAIEVKASATFGLHAKDQTYGVMGTYKGMDNQTLSLSLNHYKGEPFTYTFFLEDYSFINFSWSYWF